MKTLFYLLLFFSFTSYSQNKSEVRYFQNPDLNLFGSLPDYPNELKFENEIFGKDTLRYLDNYGAINNFHRVKYLNGKIYSISENLKFNEWFFYYDKRGFIKQICSESEGGYFDLMNYECDKKGRIVKSMSFNFPIIKMTKYDRKNNKIEELVNRNCYLSSLNATYTTSTKWIYDKGGKCTKYILKDNLNKIDTISLTGYEFYHDSRPDSNKYNENGQLVEGIDEKGLQCINKYDDNNNLIEKQLICCNYKNPHNILKFDEFGNLIEKIDFDWNGNIQGENKYFFDGDFLIEDEEKVFGDSLISFIVTKFNRRGKIIEQKYLDKNKELNDSWSGIAIINTDYNEDGKKIKEEYFDAKEQHLTTFLWKYDERGKVIEKSDERTLVLFFENVFSDASITKWRYNDLGQMQSKTEYDNKNNVLTRETWQYDKNNFLIEHAIFGKDAVPVNAWWQTVHKRKYINFKTKCKDCPVLKYYDIDGVEVKKPY